MEETRHSLQDKLETLEEQVKNTVQEATETVSTVKETVESVKETVKESVGTVQEAVHETVQSVKESLNLERQVREHPWAMFAGAAALGFIGGRLLYRVTAEPKSSVTLPAAASFTMAPSPMAPLPAAQGSSYGAGNQPHHGNGFKAAPAPAEPSWWHSIAEHYQDELDKLKSLAVSALGNVIREVLTTSAPPAVANQLRDVVDGMTTKFGGEPMQGSILGKWSDSSSEQEEMRHGCDEAKMGRPMGATER